MPELLLPVQRCLELLSIGLDAASVRRVVVVCSASVTSQTWQVRGSVQSGLAGCTTSRITTRCIYCIISCTASCASCVSSAALVFCSFSRHQALTLTLPALCTHQICGLQVRQQALSTLAILVSSVQLADPLFPGERRLVITPAVKAVQRQAAAILQVRCRCKLTQCRHTALGLDMWPTTCASVPAGLCYCFCRFWSRLRRTR